MGLKDFLPGAGKGPEAKVRGQEPTPEKRRFGNFLSQIPPEFQSRVRNIASDNHAYFRESFPTLPEFEDAVAESWLEKRRGFEEEARRLGFSPIEPGTRASDLNKSTLAYLTASGSFVVLGPGSFEKNVPNAPGAAFSYVKIPLRKSPDTPEDVIQPSGVFVHFTPTRGRRISVKGLIPQSEDDPGILFTSNVIDQMMKTTPRSEALPALEGLKTAISKRFEDINQEVGIVLAHPKK